MNRALGTLAVAIAALLVVTSSAWADFGVSSFTFSTSDDQAGAHADQTTQIAFNLDGAGNADGNVKDLEIDLPRGFAGDPQSTPKCDQAALYPPSCPTATQVGVADLMIGIRAFNLTQHVVMPVYNMAPAKDRPADFGFDPVDAFPTHLMVGVRSDGDYGLRVSIPAVSHFLDLQSTTVTLWGVPADPSHDQERMAPGGGCFPDCSLNPPIQSGLPRRPFMRNATECAGPGTVVLRADSWQHPREWLTMRTPSPAMTGCEKVPFSPALSVAPATSQAGSPGGYQIDLKVPQSESPDGLATSDLRRAVVTLPEGVALSPSVADGLGACSDADFGMGSLGAPTCPNAAKVGSVEVTTPVLPDKMTGSAYVGQPESGNPYRLFLAAEGDGVRLKLQGKLTLDPATGRVTATFDNNPQLPFSDLHLAFKGGPTSPLVNPRECGSKTAVAEFTSWSGRTVTAQDTVGFTGCGAPQFKPSLDAGLVEPVAGSSSTFVLRVQRTDADKELGTISATLPPGLLGKIAGVPRCTDAQAGAGACPAGSQIGRVEVGAGAGSDPFYIRTGKVFLTEGYKGAPFGLDIAVPAVAGPYDLGLVNVRAAVRVDPITTQMSIASDPMPVIKEGIPLQLRDVRVIVDRPGFVQAPTSCDPMKVAARIGSPEGDAADLSNRFQVGECASLPFAPKVGIRLTNKTQTAVGRHPGLDVLVTQGAGQANLKKVVATLPLSLALDPEHSKVCSFPDALKVHCPVSTEIGTAEAISPLLDKPLYGKVYFVQGLRVSKGHLVRTLPTLLIPLRGEIHVNLRATTTVLADGRLMTSFAQIPDARLSGFRLQLRGGKHGILVVTGKKQLCRGTHVVAMQTMGQNGKRRDVAVRMTTPCGAGGSGRKR